VLHGFRPIHTFKAPGTYAVTLLVEDAYGGTSEDAFNVTVGKAEAEKAPWGLVALAVVFLLVLAAVLWLVFTPVRPSARTRRGGERAGDAEEGDVRAALGKRAFPDAHLGARRNRRRRGAARAIGVRLPGPLPERPRRPWPPHEAHQPVRVRR